MSILRAFTLQKMHRRLEITPRISLLVFSAVYFVCCIFLPEGYAKTIEARSCSYTDVSGAVSSATRGDTVTVPAGKCIWGSELVVTKAIRLQGAGIDVTTIKSGMTGGTGYSTSKFLFRYVPSSPSSDASELFELTGFTFDEDSKSGSIIVRNENATPLRKVRIHHNKIINSYGVEVTSNEYATSITIEGTVYGVIDNNTIIGVPRIGNYGNSYATLGRSSWDNTTFKYGSPDNIYWEDNIFIKDTILISDARQLLSYGDRGGRYVFRYNNIINSTTNPFYAWDMHGTQVGGTPTSPGYRNRSTMGAEIYGNHISNPYSALQIWGHRGGKLLAFYNYVMDGSNTIQAVILDEASERWAPTNHACLGLGYSACSSDGERQEQTKSFYWNNRKSSNNGLIITKLISDTRWDQWGGNKLRENENFWNHNTGFNGTLGMGCGTLANRPKTCTEGVGYWATDQSCSQVPEASVGKAPKTPISGTLYRCVATNSWQEYYTPYTYPHPLRTGETEILSAPKGFKLVN